MVRGFEKRNPPVRLSRAAVEHVYDYASKNCCLENFVLVRLFRQLGPRTSELCTLRVEHINFETCHVKIFDSKKKELVELPLDIETTELLHLLIGNRCEGYVFRQLTSWKHVKGDKPLTKQTVWCRINQIALKAGVRGVKPRTFRQYFAVCWDYKKRGSRKGLQFILRHDSETSTDAYVEKISLDEEIELEYRMHMDPIARALHSEALPLVCRDCSNTRVCKHLDELIPYSEVVTGCKFKVSKIPSASPNPQNARSNGGYPSGASATSSAKLTDTFFPSANNFNSANGHVKHFLNTPLLSQKSTPLPVFDIVNSPIALTKPKQITPSKVELQTSEPYP